MSGHVAQRWPRWEGPSGLLQLRDHTTACSELRVGTGPDPQVLVLVHAALLDRHMWSVVAQRLGGALAGDWRIVAHDLRGHGDARDAPPITGIDQLGDDLRDLVDALRTPRAHVVGLSLGGAVAQAAALRHPERVASLTLVATSCRFPPDVMERRARLAPGGVAAALPETLDRWFRPETLDDDGAGVRYARERVLATPDRIWTRTWSALGGFDVGARLAEIAAPVLAIAAAEDGAAPPAALRRLADGVGDGRSVVVDRAGHLLALDRPAELAAHIAAFLRAHP